MIYATVDDMLARFGERELVALTDPEENAALDAGRVRRALADAQALADGYVGQVYRLPLTGCRKPMPPGKVKEHAPPPGRHSPAAAARTAGASAGVAARAPSGGSEPCEAGSVGATYAPPPLLTRLTCDIARYYLHSDLAPEHEVYRRFAHARDQLAAIAEGRAQLACPWGGSPGEALHGDAQTGQGVRYQFSRRAITDDTVGSYA